MEHKTFLSSIAIILILPAMYSFNSLALETVENDKSCEALCDYYYNPPVYTTNKDNKDNIDNIIINADKTDLMAAGKFVFRGNVMVQQGARVFYADEAIILRNLDTGKIKNITANGNVKILDPNFNIDGSKIEILFNNNQDQNQDQTRTIIYDAKYTLYHQHASGQADYIIIYGQDIIKMPHAEYTTCNPAN